MRVDEATYVSAGIRLKYVIAYSSRGRKKENRMRTAIAAILVVTASAAGLFPQLRRADALTADALMGADRELSVAEPVD